MSYPILEFDPSRDAILEASTFYKPILGAEYCVLSFFNDVVEKVREKHNASTVVSLKSEMGSHPVYQITHQGRNVAFCHPGVGAPLAAGMLEELIANGFTKFVACGSGGVLDKAIQMGKIIIPDSAVREEGVSYHYLPPTREVAIPQAQIQVLANELKKNQIEHLIGKTWTTDGFYRETKSKIIKRKQEGCLTVEMECAALAAVALFRGVKFGQYLYGGDDVSGEQWDGRGWKKCEVRESLFWTSMNACINL